MTTRSQSNESARFTTSLLPGLLGAAMLAVYLVTLEHWVGPESLREISNLSGVAWLAERARPLSWLVTYPFRWLPAARIPLAINCFTAGCAALSLALLARSVALLPHDRTQAERQRNENRLGYLITGHAWLPPVLAVLVCGLQRSFWEHAVAATGEMFDLLLFAWLVCCLLEYRVDGKEARLSRFALLYGLAMANNWAMAAFLPAFLVALLWIKGMFNFLNPGFLARFLKEKPRRINLRLPVRLLGWWLAGCLLFLLPPLLASHAHDNRVAFWPALGFEIHNYLGLLRAFPLRVVVLLCLTSVLPVFFMGIRWGRLIQDAHPLAIHAVNGLFHAVHGFFLLLCVWGALDSPFSPRHINPPLPRLPLYFLGALGVGYYSGYFLLVFGARMEKFSRRPRPFAPFLNAAAIAAMWAMLLAAPTVLLYKNLPAILRQRQDGLPGYFAAIEKTLPPQGTVILSEDAGQLHFLESRLIRDGRQSDYALVDAGLLTQFPAYFQFLDAKYPQFNFSQGLTNGPAEMTNPVVLVRWLADLSLHHEIDFMHPFTGYLAELFHPEQQGLFLKLARYPTNSLDAPPPSPELLARNQAFWQELREKQFPALMQAVLPPSAPVRPNLLQGLLDLAHSVPEMDRRAALVGAYYSVMLNSWGVELQRMGSLPEAGACFGEARRLNPGNAAAQINQQCNQDLQARKPLAVDSEQRAEDRLGRNRDWDQSLREDGPIDEPNACYHLGTVCADGRMVRQAVQEFERAVALAPDSTNASLRLSELFVRLGYYTNSLDAAARVLRIDPRNPRALILQGLSLVQLGKYYQAIPPLNDLLDLQAGNTDARLARAVAFLKMDKLLAAQDDYQRVLQALPSAYPAYYGLASIARMMKDAPATATNCELYLAYAPPGAPEVAQIKSWLKESKGAVP